MAGFSQEDFEELPVDQRYAVYMGIATAAMIDVSQVSDQELQLLSYGIYRDYDLKEAVGADDFNDGMYQVRKSVADQGDNNASWELASADKAERENMQIPVTAVAIVTAFYVGAAAAGAAGVAVPGATGFAGAGAGVGGAQTLIASASTPAMMLAARMLKKAPTGIIADVAKVGSGTIAVTGHVLGGLSIWDHMVNTDENEQGRLDTIAERDAYGQVIEGVDDGYSQEEIDARNQYMGVAPSGTDQDENLTPQEKRLAYEEQRGIAQGATFDRTEGEGRMGPPPEGGLIEQPTGYSDTYQPTAVPIGGDIDPNLDNPYTGGIREGYLAKQDRPVYGTGGPGADYSGTAWVAPRYRDMDFEDLQATLTERQIDIFQDRMIRAGYMREDAKTGVMDVPTIDTLERVLYESNVNGYEWQGWSARMATEGDKRASEEDADERKARLKALGPFQRNVYLEPDYAALSLTAKDAMEQQLGRQINDWEMQFLVDEQESSYREQFEVGEAARLSNYQGQVRAIEDDLTAGDTVGGGTMQDVDPGARFQQAFESKFEKELNRREKTIDAEERTGTLMQGLNNAMGAIGGR